MDTSGIRLGEWLCIVTVALELQANPLPHQSFSVHLCEPEVAVMTLARAEQDTQACRWCPAQVGEAVFLMCSVQLVGGGLQGRVSRTGHLTVIQRLLQRGCLCVQSLLSPCSTPASSLKSTTESFLTVCLLAPLNSISAGISIPAQHALGPSPPPPGSSLLWGS